ncbi:hypothetical protein GCK32_013705 [Trichostrongylus colubriformis]|uniref:Uncharacterized protein n=1 Tax=Trichostrongylus colubriformis TaxID=6319 RepID=A0AAN8EY96_TRICO
MPMTVLEKGVLQAKLKNVSCWGRCLHRKTDRSNKPGPWINITRGAKFSCDIVESICRDRKKKDIYQMTLLAEDWMNGTLNWPDCLGYNKQPTDHYMRPFQVAIEEEASEILTKTYSKENCIEQHRDILRYLRDFVHSYRDHPKFGWIWLSLLSHDYETGLNHADSDYQRFFLDNKEKVG